MKRPLQALRIGLIAGALMIPVYAQSGGSDPNGSATPGATSGSGASGSGASGGAMSGSGASGSGTVPGTDMNTSSNRNNTGDHDFNFGWLGLVGLAGLLGLRHQNRNATYDNSRDINNTGPSGIR